MKKLLSFFIIIFIFNNLSNSQSYHKLINDTLYWDVAFAEMGYICGAYSDFGPWRYKFNGDTVINDILYSKFIGYEHFSINHPSPPKCIPFYIDTNFTSEPLFFIREDTVNRKVYRYDGYNGGDLLWYDFSAEQGDTILYPFYGEFVVDTVFEIITNDGVNRKYFECDDVFNGFYIEGIGGTGGPFGEPFYYFEAGTWLMCVKDHQDQIIWGTECYDFTTSISYPKKINHDMTIYPNPAFSSITIESLTTPSQNSFISISNTSGQQLITQEISNLRTEIDISNLPAGIYIVKLQSGKGIVTQKLVVN